MSFTDNKWDELNKTNMVYFNSTLHDIEHLGSLPLLNANGSLCLTYCQEPRPQ